MKHYTLSAPLIRGKTTMLTLQKALDDLGIEPGEAFVVGKLDLQEPGENHVGPSTRGSATSRAAALDNYPRSGTQRADILEFIVGRGEQGATRDEVIEALGMRYSSVGPRVLELIQGGFVVETERTRKTGTGSQALVMLATSRAVPTHPDQVGDHPDPDVLGGEQVSIFDFPEVQHTPGNAITEG